MASPLVAKVAKSLSRCWRCVSVSGDATQVSYMYGKAPSRPAHVRSIILWKVWAAFDQPNGMNKYSNKPNGVMMAVLGISSGATGIWWYPLTRSILEKKLCNHSSRLKGLACLGEGTCQGVVIK
jgi:hypothetical protein